MTRPVRRRPTVLAALCAGWLAVLGAAAPARAQDAHHMFWEVKGRHNTVYLLGSVHMLKAADSVLPDDVLRAYAGAGAVVMELDLSDVNALQGLSSGLGSASLPEDQSLAGALGAELYAQFLAHAVPLGLDPELVAHFQPWFAALMLEQTALSRSGFEAGSGVDMQLAQRAQADHKPITGLETIDEQLGLFAHLSPEQQRLYMRTTLQELDAGDRETTLVVGAWKRGDTAALEQLLREGSAESPQLYRLLTTDRNHRWLPKIEALMNDDHDDLVVVGALHLIGRDGLVELLQRDGYRAVQH